MFMHTQMDEGDDVDKNTSNKQVVDVLKICLTVNLKQYTPFLLPGNYRFSLYIYSSRTSASEFGQVRRATVSITQRLTASSIRILNICALE